MGQKRKRPRDTAQPAPTIFGGGGGDGSSTQGKRHKRRKGAATGTGSGAGASGGLRKSDDFGSDMPGKFRTLLKYASLVERSRTTGHLQHDDDGTRPKPSPAAKNAQSKDAGGGRAQQAKPTTAKTADKSAAKEVLKRRPGESLSDFGRRVDQALPVKLSAKGSGRASGSGNGSDGKDRGPLDPAEKRAKKQSDRQKQQNDEHLNMLRRRAEKRRAELGLDELDSDGGGEFDSDNEDDNDGGGGSGSGRGRKRGKKAKSGKRARSPDPWAVLLRPERQYKFNESVERPPALTVKGKLKKRT